MEKIINEMKKYGVSLPAVGADADEIRAAYHEVEQVSKHLDSYNSKVHAAYRYLDYLSECNTLKSCIVDKIKVYSFIAEKMENKENLFSNSAVDGKAWNSKVEDKIIEIVNDYFKPASVGLCVRVNHDKDYYNFSVYLESKKYYERDDEYMRINIINVWGNDYERLFSIPSGKVRPVFGGAAANAEMINNGIDLRKKVESLKYALMYGPSVINQINAYMEIVSRLYLSLPFEYRNTYGYKIKKYSF